MDSPLDMQKFDILCVIVLGLRDGIPWEALFYGVFMIANGG